ncbi:unnamed protein product [Sphagnum troendelagicum]
MGAAQSWPAPFPILSWKASPTSMQSSAFTCIPLVPPTFSKGKVNKVEKEYLGVVVLGLFNAAIGIADICEDLYYDDSETEEIIDLCGSLQAVHTGCVKWLDHLTKATRRKETSSPQSSCDRPLENGQKKSKHKQTTKEESGLKVSEGANEADTVSLKKRKKERDLGEDKNVTSHKSKRKKSDAGAG